MIWFILKLLGLIAVILFVLIGFVILAGGTIMLIKVLAGEEISIDDEYIDYLDDLSDK